MSSALTTPAPAPLTSAAVAQIPSSLEGETPVPSPPSSDSGRTHVESTTSSLSPKKGGSEDDLEKAEMKEETAARAAAPDFPDGGARAYFAVAGATIVMATTFGMSNSFGVFQAYYKTHQLADYPASTIAWIGSVHLFITFSSSLFSGMLFDKGWYQYQLAFGSILWLVGIFMLSLSTTYYQIFLSHSVCLGVALGSMFSPSLSTCATYFLKKRSLMLGIAAAGTAIGAIIFPIMLENTFESLGFGGAVRAVGYLMAGLLAIANLITRPRQLPPRPHVPMLPMLGRIVRQKSMWLVCGGSFCVMTGLFIPLFYIVAYSKSSGANPTLAKYSLSVINAAAFFARIISGIIADKCGSFNTVIPSAGLLAAMIFAMLGANTTVGLAFFLVLFGCAQGAVISVSAGCYFSLATHPSELGLRGGIGFLFVAVAALIGSPIAGAVLLAAGNNYVAPCCFGGAMSTVGTVLLVFGRQTQVKRRGTNKV